MSVFDYLSVFTENEAACVILEINDLDNPKVEMLAQEIKRTLTQVKPSDMVQNPLCLTVESKIAPTAITRNTLRAWCETKGQYPLSLFPERYANSGPIKNQAIDHSDPLGGYRTPALNALIAAVHEFWVNRDPTKPAKHEQIVTWLIENHGLTRNMAAGIDRIIRPEDRRQGGNVKNPPTSSK